MFRASCTTRSDQYPGKPHFFPAASHGLLVLCVCLTLAIGCVRTQNRPDPEPIDQEIEIGKTSFSFDQTQQPFNMLQAYRLVPGDVLDVLYHIKNTDLGQVHFKIKVDYEVSVKFVNFPDFNETQVVRPDGTISLPYLGQVKVAELSVDELTANLREQYSKIMRFPELYVLVPEYRRDIEQFKADLHTAPRGLSRLVTVRPDGFATFAMLGDVRVVGRTIPEVNAELNEKYPDIFPMLRSDLFLETHAGSQIYVLGEVNNQGSYAVNDFTTVVEGLALAGGPTTKAQLDSLVIFRRDSESRLMARKVDVKKMLNMEDGAIAFYLLPNDVVFVPKRKVYKVAEMTQEVADVILFRGWSVNAGVNYDLNGDGGSNNNN